MQPDVRQTALEILNRLSQNDQTLDSVMREVSGQTEMWLRRDRALLNALVYGVLRWRGRLDYIINHHSKTPFSRIDSNVLNILRLGLFQIGYLSKIPVAAAVDTSVELAKSTKAPWVVGYVNAVLRNAARDYQTAAFPDLEKDPVTGLAAMKSFPEWLIRRWLEDNGIEKTIALCDAINTIPAITLRTNTLLAARKELAAALENEAEKIALTDHAPDGVSMRNPAKPIAQMASFRQGWFQIQDEAAQLVTLFLAPQPGETIMDACAGLGGKTGHIAQLMQNKGKIVALDINESKLNELQSQMKRLHVTIVTTSNHNLNVPPGKYRFGIFDRILLDAPCSGLGVLRRNPDVKWNTSEEQLQGHMGKQLRFLNNLAHIVKPEGVLVYAVCSNEREENEEVINEFLNLHPEFVLDNHPGGLSENAGAFITQQGYLKTFPYPHNMDGFFSARFKRIR
ncbi:MAG: 16S rRNA (cytosine(967)-C(5))-methyltransferase RsmB [Deltaproteobacteria bacterium]|nr:MAG: 16S rRNA (cytosine(967)-C(5))-methyltransferase RsmB [Deltaproteobacteria bacterium]